MADQLITALLAGLCAGSRWFSFVTECNMNGQKMESQAVDEQGDEVDLPGVISSHTRGDQGQERMDGWVAM